MRKAIFALVAGIMCFSANAAVDKNLVKSAEKYLNSITGLQGGFVQVANGQKQNGTFSMLRPGRVRLDYKDAPIQLIADGKDLYFYDKSLDQITTVPLTSTPAGILVRKKIDLQNADINVFETSSDKNTFTLQMNLRGQEGLGHMAVVFDKQPVKLNSWSVVDATSAKTDVVFQNLKAKTDFGKNYFQLSRHKTVSTSGGDDFYD
ncbi:MAG: outer membrane lipoprotein carrier protein LolA [Alphaproteobacteria bacterium]|nr:outer membrane lipoprotein carrier protein LolA [Alphaproteobacteria bacterium]MBR0212042.1 outer membrane lipoprotein carrier protein LolA [Alphaproteobacteria bacterium]